MRMLHRWIMTVCVVFLLYVAATGVLLNSYDYLDPAQAYAREGGGLGADAPQRVMGIEIAAAVPLQQSQLLPALRVALAGARARVPGSPVASVELHVDQGVPVATVTMSRDPKHPLRFNGMTGELWPALPGSAPTLAAAADYHGSIKSWHRGTRFGPIGATMVFLTGCAFLGLCITGILMYFRMWRTRRGAGRSGFFWS